MDKIEINIPKDKNISYPIFIGENLLENAENYIHTATKAKKFLIATNSTIYPRYKNRLKIHNSEYLILPDGEEYKTLDTVKTIIDKAIEMKLDRTCAIIAFGGGVIGDMAGFAAAIYERGIDFIQIPTTLLAQVDSSVGGKVGVNHREGKNLIGNFYQPKLVLSDISTLYTLDLKQFKTGLAEVLKYAFIEKSCLDDEQHNLFEFLRENREKIYQKDSATLTQLISVCCKLKRSVVVKDEKEKGLRAILNFGHTFAHAIEKTTNYTKYTHGEAVSIGMKYAFLLAKELKSGNEDYINSCLNLLKDFELTIELADKAEPSELYESMTTDKKNKGGKIRFVLPSNDFEVVIKDDVDKETVLSILMR